VTQSLTDSYIRYYASTLSAV